MMFLFSKNATVEPCSDVMRTLSQTNIVDLEAQTVSAKSVQKSSSKKSKKTDQAKVSVNSNPPSSSSNETSAPLNVHAASPVRPVAAGVSKKKSKKKKTQTVEPAATPVVVKPKLYSKRWLFGIGTVVMTTAIVSVVVGYTFIKANSKKGASAAPATTPTPTVSASASLFSTSIYSSPASTVVPSATPTPTPLSTPWLLTQQNQILQADNLFSGVGTPADTQLFYGQGANIQDTRDCRLCASDVTLETVLGRIDDLVSIQGVNFMRLTLESDNPSQMLSNDAQYASDVKSIFDHVGSKPGVYLLASIWHNPTLTAYGWPTNQTYVEYEKLVELAGNASHILFGLSNEPKWNDNGVNDTLVWNAMNGGVDFIRQQEKALNVPEHIITVQGTRNWARDVNFYRQNPITAGNGSNVAYELHAYFKQNVFNQYITQPAKDLPIIIGEYGPADQLANANLTTAMNMTDAANLMTLANQLQIPHLAWTFNTACPPALLSSLTPSSNACVANGNNNFTYSDWGLEFIAGLNETARNLI